MQQVFYMYLRILRSMSVFRHYIFDTCWEDVSSLSLVYPLTLEHAYVRTYVYVHYIQYVHMWLTLL